MAGTTPPVDDGLKQERILRYKKDFHMRILDRIDRRQSLNKYELKNQVERIVDSIFQREDLPSFMEMTKEEFKKETFDNVLGYGPLESLLEDPTVDDIMVNGFNQIWCERAGRLSLHDRCFLDEQHLRTVVDRMLRAIGRSVNDMNPYVDGRLEDGSRINVVVPPLALDGSLLTIRKFPDNPLSIDDLITTHGSLTREIAEFLQIVVRNRKNLVVSGGSGSGKTTLLNALAGFIPQDERIVTIEDTAELKLPQDHVARMETRQANFEGKGSVTIRDLVRNALRMRPDRIVVGECRGGECIDMLQAMNTGHDGSLTTVHANSPEDAMLRLETMCTMSGLDIPLTSIRAQIAAAVDLVIQVGRFGDGTRKVITISEVLGFENGEILLQDLFQFTREKVLKDGSIQGTIGTTGNMPVMVDSFNDAEAAVVKKMFSSGGKKSGPVRRVGSGAKAKGKKS